MLIVYSQLGNDKTHSIPKSMIPSGFKIKSKAKNNPNYVFISEFLF